MNRDKIYAFKFSSFPLPVHTFSHLNKNIITICENKIKKKLELISAYISILPHAIQGFSSYHYKHFKSGHQTISPEYMPVMVGTHKCNLDNYLHSPSSVSEHTPNSR